MIDTLTAREREVLALVGMGLSGIEIAKRIYRTVKTVETHTTSMHAKLGTKNRVQLARVAILAGLTDIRVERTDDAVNEDGKNVLDGPNADRNERTP